VSVSLDFLRAAQQDAIQNAHKQNTIKTKHFDVWVNARTAWMNLEAWRRCADPALRLEDFAREECYEGEDLAGKVDLTARVKVFMRELDGRRHYYAFPRCYVPLDRAMDGDHQHYEKWVHEKWLVAHPGSEIHLPSIQREIEADLSRVNYKRLVFDPWGAQQMQQDLAAKVPKDTVVDMPQQTKYFSPAMKELEAAVLSSRFHFDGSPVLTWAISNVIAKADANDELFPRKQNNGIAKIDPATALLNAIYYAMVSAPAPTNNEVFFL